MARHYDRSLVDRKSINADTAPGTYRPEDAFSIYKKQGASLSGRPNELSTFKTPGVGSYDIAKQHTVYGGTMGKRYDGFMNMYKQSSETPGAGTYDLPELRKGGIGFPKGGHKQHYNDNPGPGAYDVKPIRSTSKSNKCSFGIRFKGNTF